MNEPYEDFDYAKLDTDLGWVERGNPDQAAREDTTPYAKAGEALHKIAEWVFIDHRGRPRHTKDATIRILAAASAVNPTAFQPLSFADVAKRHGFTRAALASRVKDFSKDFKFRTYATHGASPNSNHNQPSIDARTERLKAQGRKGNGWLK